MSPRRLNRYGAAGILGRCSETIKQRFDEKWVLEPNSGCWLWTGCVSPRGYARIATGVWDRGVNTAATVFAHRLSYELHVGVIPDAMVLDHLCRTPSCVNPKHLEPVTQAENIHRAPSRTDRTPERIEAAIELLRRHAPERLAPDLR